MSSHDKHSHYSAADIQKYLNGELSAREMQALEAAALEDPFLADALEGMEKDRMQRGEAAFGEDMNDLKKRLTARIAKKDRALALPFYRSAWKAAAAIILLAGLGVMTYRYLLDGDSKSVSVPASASATAPAPAPATPGSSQSDSIVMVIPPADRKDEPAPAAKQDKPASTPAIAKSHTDTSALRFNSPVLASDESKKMFRGNRFQTLPASNPQNRSLSFGTGSQPDSARRWSTNPYLVGKVTDTNNNPIPLIMISFQGRRQTVKTDNNGLFHIQMLGSDSGAHIMISSIGYQPISLPAIELAAELPANTIRLQPQNSALNDVAVGYSTQKKINKEKDLAAEQADKTDPAGLSDREARILPSAQGIVVEQAAPVTGWTAYKDYLERNKRQVSIDSTHKGTEAISFMVNKKGKLSSFKIEESISPAHDSLLLHLIRHGSTWKPLYGNKASATVILTY